ncbi:MAG: MBL fold metallo-hydrolase [Hydrogenophaga sp.]|uniref:MBL fold metallo-hydrolase n=1 Tax=Hydrogenophaga sp. TaxID=1904254 RepID=UPI003D0FA804
MFETIKVADRVYALVGDLGQRSPANLGNNMTCSFIVGDDGVVVIDTGGSRAGAQAIEAAIRAVTDKPIRWAVNTGGQDHRWLGNDHFRRVHGCTIVAAEAGLADMKARTFQQVEMARRFVGAAFEGTEVAYPDTTFAQRWTLPVRGLSVELLYTGGAHTPADLLVWLPQQRIVFAGDALFSERLLGLQPGLGLKWIAALERLRDELRPVTVVPGHGHPGPADKALADSLGYLLMLRDGARQLFDAGAFDPVEVAEKLDQSKFAYLRNYDDARFRSENAIRMADEVLKTRK